MQPRVRFSAAAPLALPVGDDAGPQALALADVNEDGVPDLVAVNRSDDEVWILLGAGDASFGAPRMLPLDGTPAAVAVADVASPFGSDRFGDVDGHVDLIVAHDDGYAEIVLGRGNGEFDPPEQDLSDVLLGLELNAVAVRDLDGNGRLDLVFLDAFDSVFFLCNEAGSFAPCATETVETQGGGALGFAVGDWTGDGLDDVAVVSRDSGDLRIIAGLGGGRFDGTSIRVTPLAGPAVDISTLAIGDLDGDQLDDLLVGTAAAAATPPRLDALIGAVAGGTAAPALSFYPGPIAVDSLALGDFDADGLTDALLDGSDGLSLSRGADAFAAASQPGGTEGILGGRVLAVADLDGDTRLDFVALDEDGEGLTVARNDTPPFCAGDCNQNDAVTIDDLLLAVNIAVGLRAADDCAVVDTDRSSTVEINELIAAVRSALDGCPAII